MFKVGDIVEITEESDATGMLDFKDGEGYKVEMVQYNFNGDFKGQLWRHQEILLRDEGGRTDWYHYTHFKLTEDIKVEKKECLFKEGQVVWDLIYGKGEVSNVDFLNFPSYPVCVKFDQLEETYKPVLGSYTAEGISSEFGIRSLYFSEPKIEAATEPLFEPTLKSGDVVIISCFKDRSDTSRFKIGVVEDENEEFIYTEGNDPWDKGGRDFYRLGEKINFK